MHTLATGFGFTWNGIDGWLYLLAGIAFLIAIIAAMGKGGRVAGKAVLFIALGLLLVVLTHLMHGG